MGLFFPIHFCLFPCDFDYFDYASRRIGMSFRITTLQVSIYRMNNFKKTFKLSNMFSPLDKHPSRESLIFLLYRGITPCLAGRLVEGDSRPFRICSRIMSSLGVEYLVQEEH